MTGKKSKGKLARENKKRSGGEGGQRYITRKDKGNEKTTGLKEDFKEKRRILKVEKGVPGNIENDIERGVNQKKKVHTKKGGSKFRTKRKRGP